VQRRLLAMQFTRAQAENSQAASRRPFTRRAAAPAHCHEYETFLAAVADWARVKEQWLEEKKRAVIRHWEHAACRS